MLRTRAAATVAAGFFDDPVTRWLLPDVDRRRAAVRLPPNTELFSADQEQAFGEAVVPPRWSDFLWRMWRDPR